MPTELVDLRGIYGAIKDGEATWKSVMENKAEQQSSDGQGGDSGAPPPTGKKDVPICTDEQFKEKTPEWRKLILEKKKTPEQLVAMLSSKMKLSEDQVMTIDAWSHDDE